MIKVTATLEVPASAAAHAARDEAYAKHLEALAETRKTRPDAIDNFGAYWLGKVKAIGSEMDSRVSQARNELDASMKRAGLKPVDATECNYGVNGGKDGAVSYWYQRRYA